MDKKVSNYQNIDPKKHTDRKKKKTIYSQDGDPLWKYY